MIRLDGLEAEPAPAPKSDYTDYKTGALMSLLQVHWFIRLRWAFVAAALAVLAVERFATPGAVRPTALVIPLLLLGFVNLLWMVLENVLLRRLTFTPGAETDSVHRALWFANAQVSVDILLLTMILRYTGGIENPMGLFYLFHMGIGAQLLRPLHAVLQGCWAMLLFGMMAVGECLGWLTPHWDLLPQLPSPGLYQRPEFVAASIAAMACGVFATLYFTLHIAGRLTEREQQLRNAHDSLRRSEAAIFDLQQRRARFLQTAAHQLKSPLAIIETLVGLLCDQVVPAGAVRATYEKIRQRCRDGIRQVEGLLTLARVQRSDPRRHRRSIADVGRVVAEVCEQYLPQAQRQGLTLTCHVPEAATPCALVDPADLTDCVSNLVENAIKFTNTPGKISVCAGFGSLSATPSEGAKNEAEDNKAAEWVSITVVDSGIGIESDILDQCRHPTTQGSIFDAFRRGNNALAARIPGTGLGLAIVREVVEQSGGRILVRSSPGVGSAFTVAFPTQSQAREKLTIRDTRETLSVVNTSSLEKPGGARSVTIRA